LSSGGLAGRISRPRDCTFAVGIPSSEAVYRHRLQAPGESFAKRYGLYDQYEHQVVRPLQALADRATRLGVRLVHDLTLDGFGSLCGDAGAHVVILFSHWDQTSVELHDGFASTQAVIDSVPPEGAGVIDLCVCHPCRLVSRLRHERPGYLIHFRNIEAKPRFWLTFYAALFLSLHQSPRSYLDAFTDLRIKLLNRFRLAREVDHDESCELTEHL
jgi:hypothetical protein